MLIFPVVFVPGEPPEFLATAALPRAIECPDGTYAYLAQMQQWTRAVDNDSKHSSRELAPRIWQIITNEDQVPGEYRATILLLT